MELEIIFSDEVFTRGLYYDDGKCSITRFNCAHDGTCGNCEIAECYGDENIIKMLKQDRKDLNRHYRV